MERYHAFPGSGVGDTVPAASLLKFAQLHGPQTMLMRKDKSGHWVKFDDALARSRKEYNEGYKAAEAADRKALKENPWCETAMLDTARAEGLKQGRKEGQVKVKAISEISAAQLAEEFQRGHTAAMESKLVELIDSHKADLSYNGALSEALAENEAQEEDLMELEGHLDYMVQLLEEYSDVQLVGERGAELAQKLTEFWKAHRVEE